jgi:calcineurin-like phosphoesterase family protein
MIFLTGDYHLGHHNLWEGMRQEEFGSMDEMDNIILDNLFSKLKHKDTLFFLGDLAMKDNPLIKVFLERLYRLSINLIYIRGNHDKNGVLKWLRYFNYTWYELLTMNINKQKLTLCHYPMISWESSHRGSWQAHAHTHGNLCPYGMSWDCGVDANDFQPLSMKEFSDIMHLLRMNKVK